MPPFHFGFSFLCMLKERQKTIKKQGFSASFFQRGSNDQLLTDDKTAEIMLWEMTYSQDVLLASNNMITVMTLYNTVMLP